MFGDPAKVAHLYDVLRAHCEAVGRPFQQITRCNFVGIMIARDEAELAAKKERHPDFDGIAGTPETVVSRLREYAEVGSQYVTFRLADAEDITAIRLLGELVLPQVAQL